MFCMKIWEKYREPPAATRACSEGDYIGTRHDLSTKPALPQWSSSAQASRATDPRGKPGFTKQWSLRWAVITLQPNRPHYRYDYWVKSSPPDLHDLIPAIHPPACEGRLRRRRQSFPSARWFLLTRCMRRLDGCWGGREGLTEAGVDHEELHGDGYRGPDHRDLEVPAGELHIMDLAQLAT
jgi:hypothetical protein